MKDLAQEPGLFVGKFATWLQYAAIILELLWGEGFRIMAWCLKIETSPIYLPSKTRLRCLRLWKRAYWPLVAATLQ
jgi:hypothetical protein